MREQTLYDDIAAITMWDCGVDFPAAGEHIKHGRIALAMYDDLNTPETHSKLLDAANGLNGEFSAARTPEYEGEDKEVIEKIEELKSIRAIFDR